MSPNIVELSPLCPPCLQFVLGIFMCQVAVYWLPLLMVLLSEHVGIEFYLHAII